MIHFVKQSGQFKPMYLADLERWEKVKENTPYIMRAERDRNHRFHSLVFAVSKVVIENLPEDHIWSNKTPYALIKSIEIALGYVEQILTMEGEIILVPESISFEKWGQEKMEEFYNKFLLYISDKFGYNPEELLLNAE